MKRSYELTVVLAPNPDEEKQKAAVGAVEKLVEKYGGKIEKNEEWGEKTLAYKIKKYVKGFYMNYLVEFDALETAKFEAKLKLEPGVIRQLLVRRE